MFHFFMCSTKYEYLYILTRTRKLKNWFSSGALFHSRFPNQNRGLCCPLNFLDHHFESETFFDFQGLFCLQHKNSLSYKNECHDINSFLTLQKHNVRGHTHQTGLRESPNRDRKQVKDIASRAPSRTQDTR
jgi:hypothetical protein